LGHSEDEVIEMKEKFDLFQIKRDMEGFVGGKIELRANKGRKKSFVREGILESTYPSIFVVRFENEQDSVSRMSFMYSDVLTKAIEVVLCKEPNKIEAEVS